MSKEEKSFVKAVIAGGTSGAIKAVIMFPTEFVKTQLQLQSRSANPKFNGIISCVTYTVKENGFFGLYRGLPTLVIGGIPTSAARFAGFEFFANLLQDEQGKMTPLKNFAAGLGAGICEATFAVTPMETIKTKIIHDQNAPVDQRKYKGFIHGVSTMVKTEGIAGIYKGLFPTILKQGTNQGTRFLVFRELKTWIQGGDPKASFTVLQSTVCGAIAGAVSVFVNNPIDVTKTQMQGLESTKYKNSFHCAKTILMTQGPMFFYRGVTPRLMRVCGDVAIQMTLYEKLVKLLNYLQGQK